MGDYECINCNEIFHRDEPPHDGYDLCELCRKILSINGFLIINDNIRKEKETTND